jgi:trehalose 2-sulfotransferase
MRLSGIFSDISMSYAGNLRIQFAAFAGERVFDPPYHRAKLPVSKTYCILFTPRSGSTWLARRIAGLDVLSCPEEYFNAEEFTNTLKLNPGRDIYEVFDIIARKHCTNNGLFGFEISYFDLEEFEQEAKLLDVMLGEHQFFYLNRRNFVAQAISLYTAVESQVFHAFEDAGPLLERRAVPYDDDKIMFWACHILQQEYGIHEWLAANRISPIRLRYEELLEDIDGVIARIARHLGVDLTGAQQRAIPQTEKITADNAASYEGLFRHRHSEFCRNWEAGRAIAPCPYVGPLPITV